jgi:hypothetical protein
MSLTENQGVFDFIKGVEGGKRDQVLGKRRREDGVQNVPTKTKKRSKVRGKEGRKLT